MDEQILLELTSYLKNLVHISASDIPDLDLYMDQVTAFMDTHLAKFKRYEEDKALTKTMINNYAKNRLLPPPVKKRYGRNHLLLLLFIYYYKSILSLGDIAQVLQPLNEKYFDQGSSLQLSDIYEEVFSLKDEGMSSLMSDIENKFQRAQQTFSQEDPKIQALSDDAQEELRLFSFLSELGFDVYLKRQLMEKIIDRLREKNVAKTQGKKNKS